MNKDVTEALMAQTNLSKSLMELSVALKDKLEQMEQRVTLLETINGILSNRVTEMERNNFPIPIK